MYMSVLHVCLCTMYMSDTFSGQMVLDPLELELQRVLRFHAGDRNPSNGSLQEQKVLLNTGLSFQLTYIL